MRTLLTRMMTVLLAIGMTNCASIIHGSRQTVRFSSQPSGAIVYIDGKEHGTTPTAVVLNRKGRVSGEVPGKKEYALSIEMDGYYPYEMQIQRTVDGWFFGNLIFGGLLGIVIDAVSGSMYQLTPNQVVATMGRNTARTDSKDGNIMISVSLDIDPNWKKIGQLEKRN